MRESQLSRGINRVFCFKHTRTVGGDNVVAFDHHRLQILADGERSSYARLEVEVHRRLDGTLAVFHQGRRLGVREAPMEAAGLRSRPKEAVQLERASSPRKPPANPAWGRYFKLPGSSRNPSAGRGRRDGDLWPSQIAATLPSVRQTEGATLESDAQRDNRMGRRISAEREAPTRTSPNSPADIQSPQCLINSKRYEGSAPHRTTAALHHTMTFSLDN